MVCPTVAAAAIFIYIAATIEAASVLSYTVRVSEADAA